MPKQNIIIYMNIIRARKGYALDGARIARKKGLNSDENAHGGRSGGKE